MLEYKLIRSKRRKTLALQVRYGQVIVRAPYQVATTFIDSFIAEKSSWLLTKIAEHKTKADYCDFTQEANILFLGESLTLNIYSGTHANVFIDTHLASISSEATTDINSTFDKTPRRQLNVVISTRINKRLTTPVAIAKQVKKQLEAYFKQEAEQLITERLELISEQTPLKPIKVSIRQYRARWGSCNNRGELSFNYLLMMTPISVIDYVIVHELCHLTFLNHSKDFWLLVEKFCPDFRAEKKWLTTHQSQLSWQNPQ